jgi:ABC-type multidrug transport system fused ATPase/permease subunit
MTFLHVQAAQQIVVLDGGRVAEIGTHDELVKKHGLYSELVSTQSLGLSLSV